MESTINNITIYNHRVRWVAFLNLAFVVGGIYLSLRFIPGASRFAPVAFLALFSLFWIKDFLFGFRLELTSDGESLHWQEGAQAGSVPLSQIKKVLIGIRQPLQIGDSRVFGWTYLRFELSFGQQESLPPNIAAGLRSHNWRLLKKLVAHIRTVSAISVEPLDEPDLIVKGWSDEQSMDIKK
ncbi:MAG: hypothetical protein AB7V14_04740 [Kiritimatiellia bacterium]